MTLSAPAYDELIVCCDFNAIYGRIVDGNVIVGTFISGNANNTVYYS